MQELESAAFSKNLKKIRKLKGITQKELAGILNISRSCISNYEAEKRQPDNDTIIRIADYFNVSVDYLLGRSKIKITAAATERLMKIQRIGDILDLGNKLDLKNAEPSAKLALIEFYSYLNTIM